MAGDSETHLRDRGNNTDVVRQPFLIGVSGGTASGKVGTPASTFGGSREWSRFILFYLKNVQQNHVEGLSRQRFAG